MSNTRIAMGFLVSAGCWVASTALAADPAVGIKTKGLTQADLSAIKALSSIGTCPRMQTFPGQSFTLSAPGSPHDGSQVIPLGCGEGRTALRVVEIHGGAVVQSLDEHPGNQWVLEGVEAVSFADVNGDGLPDLVVIASQITGMGPPGMEPFNTAGVWLGTAQGKWVADAAGNAALDGPGPTLKTVLPLLKKLYASQRHPPAR